MYWHNRNTARPIPDSRNWPSVLRLVLAITGQMSFAINDSVFDLSFEPVSEILVISHRGPSKGLEVPAHPRSFTRAFNIVRAYKEW